MGSNPCSSNHLLPYPRIVSFTKVLRITRLAETCSHCIVAGMEACLLRTLVLFDFADYAVFLQLIATHFLRAIIFSVELEQTCSKSTKTDIDDLMGTMIWVYEACWFV